MTYQKKSELTILDLNFGKFVEHKDQFEKFVAASPKTIEEAKELVKGIEGLKIETANPIVVEFKYRSYQIQKPRSYREVSEK